MVYQSTPWQRYVEFRFAVSTATLACSRQLRQGFMQHTAENWRGMKGFSVLTNPEQRAARNQTEYPSYGGLVNLLGHGLEARLFESNHFGFDNPWQGDG